jgi:hypothetical protein
MARRSWVVFIDDNAYLTNDDEFAGKVNFRDNKEILSVFFREAQALAYAKVIAERYPGKDVHVYKQFHAYSSLPKPVESKQWTDDGQLIPA